MEYTRRETDSALIESHVQFQEDGDKLIQHRELAHSL